MAPCGLPPSEGEYDSLADFIASVNRHAAQNGYAVAKNGGHGKGQSIYRCAKGRRTKSYANPDVHKSKRCKTSIQMTACPFRFSVKELDNGKALLQWSYPKGKAAEELPRDHYCSHNHEFMAEAAFVMAGPRGCRIIRSKLSP